jgi:hypothetical protein
MRDAIGAAGGALAVGASAEKWGHEELHTYGAVLLRAGKTRESIGPLRRSRQLRQSSSEVRDELLLALAYQQLGQDGESRKWLDQAARWMDRARLPATACGTVGAGPMGVLPVVIALLAGRPDPRSSTDNDAMRWWLEMEILRAEAEAALGTTAGGH